MKHQNIVLDIFNSMIIVHQYLHQIIIKIIKNYKINNILISIFIYYIQYRTQSFFTKSDRPMPYG